MEKKERIIYFDILNILACIGVVALHCNVIVHSYDGSTAWITSMVVETAAYWAAPMFIMLSGATLMDYRKRDDTRSFFKKRLKKTFVPFVIWSLLFLGLRVYSGQVAIGQLNFPYVVDSIFNARAQGIYWFFPVLFTVYFSIPVISLIPQEKRKRAFSYLIVYTLLTESALPTICYFTGITYNNQFNAPISTGYIIYVLLGYLLANTKLQRKWRLLIYFTGALGAAVRFFSTVLFSSLEGGLYQGFWGYRRTGTVALAAAVFVWIQYHDWSFLSNSQSAGKLLEKISGASFGIYLIHYYFVERLPGWLNVDIRSWE